MSDEELNGLLAIVGGVVIAVFAFVPAAALHYRRHGRFSASDLLALVAVPVYGLALWTYTLLPLPSGDWACTTAQLDPGRFVSDLQQVWTGSLRALVNTQVFAQLALNVAFFVPMGAILRLRYHRGLGWAAGLGLAVSLLIETTQLTGIWGLYSCSYRVFDVDDLIMNTSGAVLGSIAALPVAAIAARHHRDQPQPAIPTAGRRVVAMISDLLVMIFTGAVAVLVWRLWAWETRGASVLGTNLSEVDLGRVALVQWGAAFGVQALMVLLSGCTVGEWVVGLRTVALRPGWTPLRRVIKAVCGVGLFALLWAWDSVASGAALILMVLAVLLAVPFTRNHRGLINLLAGLDVEVAGGARLDAAPQLRKRDEDERSRSDP